MCHQKTNVLYVMSRTVHDFFSSLYSLEFMQSHKYHLFNKYLLTLRMYQKFLTNEQRQKSIPTCIVNKYKVKVDYKQKKSNFEYFQLTRQICLCICVCVHVSIDLQIDVVFLFISLVSFHIMVKSSFRSQVYPNCLKLTELKSSVFIIHLLDP